MKSPASQKVSSTANGPVSLAGRPRRRLRGWVRGLELVATDHGLILHGQAHSEYARQLAQQVVAEATGLPILTNAIEVS